MIEIKRNIKKPNEFKVTMTVTAGKILALTMALKDGNTPLSQELLMDLERACADTGDPDLVFYKTRGSSST